MAFSDILFEKSDRLGIITLNRPERLNAWTPAMGDEIRQAVLDAESDPAVSAIIVTGAGRAFCAGADMSMLDRSAKGGERHHSQRLSTEPDGRRPDFNGQFSYMLGLRKPTIAAINGPCVGLGFTSSLFYDIRLAAEGARLGLIFVRRGLAIEHGASWMLPRLVGVGRAIELAVTGRLMDAQEAFSIGLVNRVVPARELMAVARQMGSDIAKLCSPLGVAEAKRSIYEHLFTDLSTAIDEDDQLTVRMLGSADFKEGVKAYLEKRSPHFEGR